MSTTVQEVRVIYGNQLKVIMAKLTASASDGYVSITPDQGSIVGVSAMKTTGTIGSTGATYNPSTREAKIECTYGNADVLRVALLSE